uniref:Uncharacterized protein n=1 Tax=Buteo japonicus TaxID=224669 RepID=A0A8C0HLP5_9AVES
MDHLGTADAEDDSGSLTRLAPSPHSEAVAHEFKELSLQPSQYLPPLNERKNGECKSDCCSFLCILHLSWQLVSLTSQPHLEYFVEAYRMELFTFLNRFKTRAGV